MENPGTVARNEDHIMIYNPFGLPVKKGDVLGYRVADGINTMKVVYHSSGDAHYSDGGGVIYYMQGVKLSFCSLSLCDRGMKTVHAVFPSITFSEFI